MKSLKSELRYSQFRTPVVSGLSPGSRRLQSACASVSLPVSGVDGTHTWWAFAGSTGDETGIAFLFFLEASDPSFSSVLVSTLLQPCVPHQADVSCVLLWGCHQVTVTELCDTKWDQKAQGSAFATPTYSGHQHLGLPLVIAPVQSDKFCFSKAIFMSSGINVDNTGSIFLV